MHFQDRAPLLGVEAFDHAAQAALRDHDFSGQIQHVVELADLRSQRALRSREQVGPDGGR